MNFLRNIGTPEIIIITLVLIIFFGSKRMSEMARELGEASKELKKAKKEAKESIEAVKQEVNLEDKKEKGGA
jgi:TatA/E family protein of Tat protein translocase